MTRALLLDALGTLVELPPPAPALREELAAAGVKIRESEAAWAMGAEIAFYRAHLHHAGNAEGLASLRERCTKVLREALPAHAQRVDDLQAILLRSLRFRPYPEVPAVLEAWRAQGLRLVVVSNWDVSLHEVLETTGLAPLLDGVVTSAEAQVAKPDARLFALGLERAGVAAGEALHVGDTYDEDVLGARAAGIEPVLVARDGADAPGDVTVVRALDALQVR
ncbi:MAG TPA: HAD-IA family hydrolase [Solirubrobacteraceae bacterium]|nr:HAD-IA family hydrolase [Solirubrobacteraceae bacterium]